MPISTIGSAGINQAADTLLCTTSGNVGIGTANPQAKLHVNTTSAALYIGYGGNFDNYIQTNNNTIFTNYNASTEHMRIASDGNVGINTTTTSRAILNIDTDGSNTSAGYGLALTNAAGGGETWTLQCGDYAINNGSFTIRQTGISGTTYFKIAATTGYINAIGAYNLTTGSGANMFVSSAGDFFRSTSSLKYKKNVQDAVHGLSDVLKLRPVTYEGKSEADEGKTFGGFIAEEIHEAGLSEFVQYADDGSPDALAYGNMVSLCVKAFQEMKAIVDAQASTITQLQADVAALKAPQGTP